MSHLKHILLVMLAVLCALPAFADSKRIQKDTIPWDSLNGCFAIHKDSIRGGFIAAPVVSFSMETNWRFGVTGAYYFPTNDRKRASSITFLATYTLNKQWILQSKQKLYLDTAKRWYLESMVGYRYYPDHFYGLTNRDLGSYYSYLNHTAYAEAHPQYEILPNLSVGLDLFLRYARVGASASDSAGVMMDSVQHRWGTCGWGNQFQTGIGAHVEYDTRDSRYWATKGLYLKGSATYYVPGISTFPYARFQADYRQYLTTARDQVLCWQVFWDATAGNVPFYDRPTLGGEDHLRGFRQGEFNGQFSWGVQAEYRIPLFWRLSGVLFGGIGDAHEWKDWRIYDVKYNYGIGARCRFNKQNTNIRADMAFNSITHEPNFIITIGEAW